MTTVYSSGLKLFNSASSAGAAGLGTAWTSPLNARVDDASYATAAIGSGVSTRYLTLTNPVVPWAIPADAVIVGCQFTHKGKVSVTNQGQIAEVGPYKAGVLGTNNIAVDLTSTDTETQTGSNSSGLGGATLTPAIINATSFGMYLRCISTEPSP